MPYPKGSTNMPSYCCYPRCEKCYDKEDCPFSTIYDKEVK